MKSIKKILSIFLIFMLCFAVSFGSSACDFSKHGLVGPWIIEYDETDYLDDTEDDVGFPNNVRFYRYLNIFNNAQNSGKLYVNSVEMLAAYIEYVNFYAITKKVDIAITYSADDFYSEYVAASELYENGAHMVIGHEAAIGHSGKTGSYRITKSDAETLATKTFDEEKEYVSAQTDYSLKMVVSPENARAEDYDEFALNSRTKILTNITNSEQLRWAISNGYKPQCVAGSPAESVLNSAKTVLREIISEDMDDLAKLRAIYEWLALNVQYDNLAAQELQTNAALKASEYDAWYAEGVFDNQKAVCEGYAKALIIMAGLEGIPAIFITGDGHAWNRVMLDGEWYVVDATHADVHVENKEVFSYGSFLITDAEKTHRGYTSTDYTDFAATTEFNIFENLTFTYNEYEYNLVIESAAELKAVLEYAKSLNPTVGEIGCTVDVFVKQEDVMKVELWKDRFDIKALYKNTLTPDYDLNGNAHYTFYLK
ncbi:MAG: transglutaminase domain-containing protein [Clostridia bacterium]|nr:transglutaminase domain-containing protein [Clostridia bacterium]